MGFERYNHPPSTCLLLRAGLTPIIPTDHADMHAGCGGRKEPASPATISLASGTEVKRTLPHCAVLQFGTAIAWWRHARAPGAAVNLQQLSPLSAIAGLALIGAGQVIPLTPTTEWLQYAAVQSARPLEMFLSIGLWHVQTTLISSHAITGA